MNTIIKNLQDSFFSVFNNSSEPRFFFSPGRINIIGEHTDYSGGLVFPAGINKGTYIAAAPNNKGVLRIASANFESTISTISLDTLSAKDNSWCDFVKGVLLELLTPHKDLAIGFDALVFGNIPNGAGLSSSASFEMVLAMTFLGLNGLPLPLPGSEEMTAYVKMAQSAENNFVGLNCGIMDQFASAHARKEQAIQLDCFDLRFKYCPVELHEYGILVINSNKQRKLGESKYNQRRSECEAGFKIIKEAGAAEEVLGRITAENWESYRPLFEQEEVIRKRVEHVVQENERVKQTYSALQNNDIDTFAALINSSGDSLKNKFEVTGFHLDSLVDAARSTEGVLAARMMGGGFGGCTINIIKKQLKENIVDTINKKYKEKTEIKPDFYDFDIGDGARELK